MKCPSSPAAELHHLEQLLMKWPMSIRIRRKVNELRQVVDQQRENRLRKLRGEIRRNLAGASLDTLAAVARELRSAS
jgi:hypothetical protein